MEIVVLYRELSLDKNLNKGQGDSTASPSLNDSRQSTSNCDSVLRALQELEHAAVKVNVTLDWLKSLRASQYELAFNLCDDGFKCRSELEPHVSAVLDVFEIPYTGAGYLSLGMCIDKHLTKKILEAHGIRTPRYQLFERGDERLRKGLSFPLIVKPCREDASIGIKRDSVVEDEGALRRKVYEVIGRLRQPALVEEYIEGREINVGIIGDREKVVLPLSEIIFEGLPEHLNRICCYEAKWIEESIVFQKTPPRCPAEVDEKLRRKLVRIALKAYEIMRCRDYGRVDFRIDGDGVPYVLEVNPNPDISEDAGLANMGRAADMSYRDVIGFIVKSASSRYGISFDT